ncbi:bacteriocin-like WGxF protein [Bacillus sp. Hm123]|uniref:bacteriocin-like WGxF protein n=1 Tax=Bacillus sp. Hm123 TaxID=3450745 RepID=UPI003F43875B
MRIVGLSLLNCFLILFTVLIHKIIYRTMLLNYESLIMYWGIFVAVFFVLNILSNIIFIKKNDR